MPYCSVLCCKKKSATSSLQKDGVTFHIFPKDPELRDIWKKFCNTKRTWEPKKTSAICSSHFKTSDFKFFTNNRRLVENSIPTLIPDCDCASHPISEPSGSSSQQHSHPINEPTESSSQQQHIQSTGPVEKYGPKSTSQEKSETFSLRKSKMQNQIDFQKKKIKRLQAKNRYLQKKVTTLEEILHSLDEKSLADKEEKMVIEAIGVEEKELIQRQLKKSASEKLSKAKYSPELRSFASTLYFYSPKAYKYVRKTFGTCLPHPRTLSKWYSDIDGRPGFTKEALVALKHKADANPDNKV